MRRKFFILIFTAGFIFAANSQSVEPIKMVVELHADSVKVMGTAKGLLGETEILKKKAIDAAKGEADVLADTDFFYEEDGDSLKVTVTGFPARYVNLRLKTQEYSNIMSFNVSSPNEKNDSSSDVGKGVYFSVKTQYLIHAGWDYYDKGDSEYGFNISIGGFSKYFLIAGDIGIIFDSRTSELSGMDNFAFFGARVQPTEWFQIIPGISYGLGVSYEYFSLGGSFVKLLFGQNKTWFEISHRWHFVYFNTHQIMCGFTYAPSKKHK